MPIRLTPDTSKKTTIMAYPLTNKTTNSANETKQGWFSQVNMPCHALSLTVAPGIAEKSVIRVSPLESEDPDVGESELPANFGEVANGIYRSAFPQSCNIPALKLLKLLTIM